MTLKKTKRSVKKAKLGPITSNNGLPFRNSNTVAENLWLRFAGSLRDDPDVKEVERIIDNQGDKWVSV